MVRGVTRTVTHCERVKEPMEHVGKESIFFIITMDCGHKRKRALSEGAKLKGEKARCLECSGGGE